MKKLFVTISLVAAGMFAANAQDGLPVKGDYSIGVNATPFLDYVGGLLSNAGSVAPSFNSNSSNPNLGIRGRYFTADNKAVRVDFVFGQFSTKSDTATADPSKFDQTKTNSFTSGLSTGIEYKRFKGRVIASYGPQVSVGYTSGGKTTEYTANTNTTVETKGGNTFQIGAGGFIGVEYFFTKNISLGGEYGLGFNFTNISEKTKTDAGTTSTTDGVKNSFSFANTPTSGLSLSIYF
jgi:hypothetical protein